MATKTKIKSNLTVQGTIYDAFNASMPNVLVKAYDKDLRTEQILGEVVTDKNGQYLIEYTASKFLRAEKAQADIFIVVSKVGRIAKELGRSTVHFNVLPEFTLDFKIDGSSYIGIAEFDALINVVQPLLSSRRIKIENLKEDDKFQDISFLAGETGEPKERLELLPIAYEFGTLAKLDPDVFYGLFRMSFPQTWNELFLVKRESIKEGLEAAIKENIISSKYSSQIKKILTHFDALSSVLVLQEDNVENKDFKKVLSHVLSQPKDQKTVVDTWLKYEEEPEKFWKKLVTIQGFKDGKKIRALQHSLHLNVLTLKQSALTNLLVEEGKKDSDLKDVRGFAKFEEKDWKKRIDKLVSNGSIKTFPVGVKGDTSEEKSAHYAETLTRFYKELYPTSVFASKMIKDRKVVFESGVKNDLKTFFSNNPDFNLETTKIKQEFKEANTNSVRDKEKLLQN